MDSRESATTRSAHFTNSLWCGGRWDDTMTWNGRKGWDGDVEYLETKTRNVFQLQYLHDQKEMMMTLD